MIVNDRSEMLKKERKGFMKNFIKVLLVSLMLICLPLYAVSAEESGKETEEQTRTVSVPVNKTGSLYINGTEIKVTINGYVNYNSITGAVESWSLSASTNIGSIIHQSYSVSGTQVKCTITVSYNGLTKNKVIYVPWDLCWST